MIRYKDNPVLLDRIIQDICTVLLAKLPWLNEAFGRAYKLVDKGQDFERFTHPVTYTGNGEYMSLLPNDTFGNFSWLEVYDPQEVDTTVIAKPKLIVRGALIFWYNLESIYEDKSLLYTEEIKNEVLNILTTPGIIPSIGRITVTEIYERPENIYKGYSIENIDKQFFMYPYAGLRLEFTIKTKELC